MKILKLLIPICCMLLMFSCNKEENIDLQEDQMAESRRGNPKDCNPRFTEGNFRDLFGQSEINTQFEGDWKGPFEESLFPCLDLSVQGDCCRERETIFDLSVNIFSVPYFTTCNEVLSAEEQQLIYEEIVAIGNQQIVMCEDGPWRMQPVAYDVFAHSGLACPFPEDHPCTDEEVEHPCDCYDEDPEHSYWQMCQTYTLKVNIKYAYMGDCSTPGQLGPG